MATAIASNKHKIYSNLSEKVQRGISGREEHDVFPVPSDVNLWGKR